MIGETAYIYDPNLRVYVDDDGNETRTPFYRKSFRQYKIVGETTKSWLCDDYGRTLKISKADHLISRGNYSPLQAYIGCEAWERHVWVRENMHCITDRVRDCRDYDKLRQIDAILAE